MITPRVCYVANNAINNALEGHNIASIRIIESAFQSGIDSKVVTLEKNSISPTANYYPIRTFSISKRRTSVFPSLGEIFSSFEAMLNVKQLDTDIIHLLNVTKEIFTVTGKLLKINKPKVAHFFHSSYPFKNRFLSFQFRQLLLKIKFFDNIFCTNELLSKYLKKNSGLDHSKISYVPYPIDVHKFRPRDKEKLREKYGFSQEQPIILYIGQIDPNRGFFHILKAYNKLFEKMPKTILYICHPNLKEENKHFAPLFNYLSAEYSNNVIISGPSSHVEEIYSLADMIVIPFRQPYWITSPPLVFIEAMASGTPVVTTPLDAIKDIGKDKENVFFTSPDDIDSLVETLLYVIENSDVATRIGLNARKYAIEKFSMDIVGELLKKIYSEILEY